MDPPIVPGFTKTSGMYNVMFMKADKFGNLPYDINCMDRVVLGIMDLIMFFARSEDGNFEKIKSRF